MQLGRLTRPIGLGAGPSLFRHAEPKWLEASAPQPPPALVAGSSNRAAVSMGRLHRNRSLFRPLIDRATAAIPWSAVSLRPGLGLSRWLCRGPIRRVGLAGSAGRGRPSHLPNGLKVQGDQAHFLRLGVLALARRNPSGTPTSGDSLRVQGASAATATRVDIQVAVALGTHPHHPISLCQGIQSCRGDRAAGPVCRVRGSYLARRRGLHRSCDCIEIRDGGPGIRRRIRGCVGACEELPNVFLICPLQLLDARAPVRLRTRTPSSPGTRRAGRGLIRWCGGRS